MKTLIIGFDGMEPSLLFSMLDQCPTFRALCKRGAWGPLESVVVPGSPVPVTGPAWWTFYTGLLPEHHGVTAFGVEGWLTSSVRPGVEPAFCQYRSAAMLAAPATYPVPSAWRADVVCGYPGPWDHVEVAAKDGDKAAAWSRGCVVPAYMPMSVWRGYVNGWHELTADHNLSMLAQGNDAARAEMILLCKRASITTVTLLRNYRMWRHPEVVFVADMASDMFGHLFPFMSSDERSECYTFLDHLFMHLLAAASCDIAETNIIIVSDHGNALDNADHALHGVFVAAGPDIASAGQLDGLRLLDVQPTLCALHGVPCLDVDGVVDPRWLARGPDDADGYRCEADRDAVAERLRAMGYIE